MWLSWTEQITADGCQKTFMLTNNYHQYAQSHINFMYLSFRSPTEKAYPSTATRVTSRVTTSSKKGMANLGQKLISDRLLLAQNARESVMSSRSMRSPLILNLIIKTTLPSRHFFTKGYILILVEQLKLNFETWFLK